MPDGDFFWKAWRTSNLSRASPSRGSAELSDAEGVPHVVLDRHWKAQKVALGRPDPVQRLLVGGRDTTHFMIIPVLGYSGKRALIDHGPSAGHWVILERRSKPSLSASAPGEAAAHFGPGNGLHRSAIELGDAAVTSIAHTASASSPSSISRLSTSDPARAARASIGSAPGGRRSCSVTRALNVWNPDLRAVATCSAPQRSGRAVE